MTLHRALFLLACFVGGGWIGVLLFGFTPSSPRVFVSVFLMIWFLGVPWIDRAPDADQ